MLTPWFYGEIISGAAAERLQLCCDNERLLNWESIDAQR
jgi:hypothetical protein